MRPVRRGFIITPSMTTSEPGTMRAATRGKAADHAHHQARARAGIAEIEDVRRIGEAAEADADDAPASLAEALHRGAEGLGRRGRAQDVVAFEQALDAGLADAEQSQDHRPVGDRLVARRPQRALEGEAGRGGEGLGRRIVGHGQDFSAARGPGSMIRLYDRPVITQAGPRHPSRPGPERSPREQPAPPRAGTRI